MRVNAISTLGRGLLVVGLSLWTVVDVADGIDDHAAWARCHVLATLQSSGSNRSTAQAWHERRVVLQLSLLRGMSLWPLPERSPPHPLMHSRRDYDGYTVENVALESMPGFYCTGNLYRPLGRYPCCPAVLCPHGHFPLGRYEPDQQILCAALARMGVVVFSYSMVGFNDAQQTTHADAYVLGLQTWNSIRAVDFLSGLPEVDARRIGVVGVSGGGSQALLLAAVEDRISVSAPLEIVYPWSWFSPACPCETGLPLPPPLERPAMDQTNAIELAAIAAPRPQLFVSCDLNHDGDGPDPTQDFPTVGLPFIEQVYRLMGCAERVHSIYLVHERHAAGPRLRKAVYDFLAQTWGLSERDENQIRLEQPEELSVFNRRYPLPPHALHGRQEVDKAFLGLKRPQPCQ
jgi:hypothetical protein